MLIQRNIISQIEDHLERPEIKLITGAKQIGKTTILKMLLAKLHREGRQTLFFNLDFEKDFRYVESQETFLRKIKLEAGNDPVFVFIDEIQRKENAGLFLKGIYDLEAPQLKMIVSGSGSLELKENIHESLVGRKRIFEILPVKMFYIPDFLIIFTQTKTNSYAKVINHRVTCRFNSHSICSAER